MLPRLVGPLWQHIMSSLQRAERKIDFDPGYRILGRDVNVLVVFYAVVAPGSLSP